MDTDFSKLPSHNHQLLHNMEGRTIARMVRYEYFFPGSQDFVDLHSEHDPLELFSRGGGPVQIWLKDYVSIWLDTHPSLCSMELGIERDEHGVLQVQRDPLESDPEYFTVDTSNQQYCTDRIRAVIGKRIDQITILKLLREPGVFVEEDGTTHYVKDLSGRPRESGIKLYLEGGEELIICEGLHHPSDDLHVIFSDMVYPRYRDMLHEFELDQLEPWVEPDE